MMKYPAVVAEVAKQAQIPKREASRLLQALARVLQDNVLAGEEVQIRRIGRFKRSFVAPGKRRSPTGNPLKRVLNVVNFKPAKSFRERLRSNDYGR